MSRTSDCFDEYGNYGENNPPIRDMTEEERKASIEREKANSVVSKAMMADEPDDYEIPLEGYEAALGNDLSALQTRIEELEAEVKSMAMDSIAADLSIEMASGRIEELEAKLSWAMEGLPQIKSDLEDRDYNSAYLICKHILEQLTGDKDG